jgi:hypothetical protein
MNTKMKVCIRARSACIEDGTFKRCEKICHTTGCYFYKSGTMKEFKEWYKKVTGENYKR